MLKVLCAVLILALSTPAAPARADAWDDGLEAFRLGDYKAARTIWWPLAKAGDTRAMDRIGRFYLIGLGVERDLKQAFKIFRFSAEQGSSVAQYNLALMYRQGLGLKPSRKKALKWLRRAAADRKNARAQLTLGIWYDQGYGVARDPVKALMWHIIAGTHASG